LLIRKALEDVSNEAGTDVRTTSIEPQADPTIDPGQFTFTPPA
jgi:hypothetical protein